MKIGAVVVLYNPNIDEIKNINSYINKSDYIFIIDNSSEENSDLIIENLESMGNVMYIYNEENIGLCRALNNGIAMARDKGCQWTVIFDADSKIKTDIFKVYKETINSYKNIENVAVFAPQHTFDRRKKEIYRGYKEVDWAMTSGWIVNNAIFQNLNGFFEPLFVDGLDLDYCHYAKEKGYKIIECGEAMIEHHPAVTKSFRIFNKKIKLGTASPYRYYLQARCLVWNFKRYHHFSDIKMYFIKWAKVLLFFDNRKEYVRNLIHGTKDGIKLYKKYKLTR